MAGDERHDPAYAVAFGVSVEALGMTTTDNEKQSSMDTPVWDALVTTTGDPTTYP